MCFLLSGAHIFPLCLGFGANVAVQNSDGAAEFPLVEPQDHPACRGIPQENRELREGLCTGMSFPSQQIPCRRSSGAPSWISILGGVERMVPWGN